MLHHAIRDKLPTIPEDLSEYARIHTGPGSWSAESQFIEVGRADFPTPHAPCVVLEDLPDH